MYRQMIVKLTVNADEVIGMFLNGRNLVADASAFTKRHDIRIFHLASQKGFLAGSLFTHEQRQVLLITDAEVTRGPASTVDKAAA